MEALRPYLPTVLPLLFLILFFAVPMGMMFALGFRGEHTDALTLSTYRRVLADELTGEGVLRTLVMSTLVAVCVTVMAYPIAYFLARSSSKLRTLVFAAAIAPELAGVVLRTYGWWIILDDDGLINSALLSLGLIAAPLPLMNNMFGVVVGLTHVTLPFGILALMTNIQGIDPHMEKAARTLGASRLAILRYILLPLSMSGIVSSFFVAFALAASAYATPAILGGSTFGVLATMIYEEIEFFVNWPGAAVLANLLLVIVLAVGFFGARLETRMQSRLKA
jgi:putative spermidine/putrescine transport system permease protein